MKKTMIFILIALFAIGVVSAANLKIGVLSTYSDGNLGGVAGADAKCQNEFGTNFKALIGATGVRDKNTDWVMQPNTTYYQIDGTTLIDTTGSDACFTFDLDNPMENIGYSRSAWTGLDSQCTTLIYGAERDCNKWTTNDENAHGGTGDSGRIDKGVINHMSIGGDPISCVWGYGRLYCVEQPSQQQGGGAVPEINKSATIVAVLAIALIAGMLLFRKR